MQSTSPAVDPSRVRPLKVLQDGIVAGLVGAFVVAGVHLVADLLLAEPLRTPAVLGALFSEGVEAARVAEPSAELAFRFTLLHLSAWAVLGVVGSFVITLVDAHPRLAPLVFGVFAFVFISLMYLSGAFSIEGLEPLHLWAGTLFGAAAAAAVLARRHPKLARHVEREHLTPTTRTEIERALGHELRAWKTYRSAADRFPNALLARIVAEKHDRAQLLRSLVEDLGLERTEASEVEALWTAETLDEAIRLGLDAENDTVAFYDRFLAVVPEVQIRDVFLRLRHHVADSTIPELEAAEAGATVD